MKYFNYAQEEQTLQKEKENFMRNHALRMKELNAAIDQLNKLEEEAEVNGKNENIAKELCDILNTI